MALFWLWIKKRPEKFSWRRSVLWNQHHHRHTTVFQYPLSGIFALMGSAYTRMYSVACRPSTRIGDRLAGHAGRTTDTCGCRGCTLCLQPHYPLSAFQWPWMTFYVKIMFWGHELWRILETVFFRDNCVKTNTLISCYQLKCTTGILVSRKFLADISRGFSGKKASNDSRVVRCRNWKFLVLLVDIISVTFENDNAIYGT